ncbi:MAG: hypothetical protein JWN04_1809 [Myxococcaceae bacterium]|nr:hypothetical protein [Myxococcaceae bacterium]
MRCRRVSASMLSFTLGLSACDPHADPADATGDDVAQLERECKSGDFAVCRSLALQYEDGDEVAQDSARAGVLMKRACDGGDMPACTLMGLAYVLGRLGFTPDDQQAVSYLRRACDGGDAHGCGSLGNAYRYGRGVPMDVSEAESYWRTACDGGDDLSCSLLEDAGAAGDGGAARADADAGRARDAAVQPSGLLPIEAIANSWYNRQDYMQLTFVSTNFLLLRDGSYRRGLPSGTLDSFNPAADRSANPGSWGTWKKDSDGRYALNGQVPSNETVLQPARAGERVSGTWTSASSVVVGTTVSQSRRSLTLDADGSFSSYGVAQIATGDPSVTAQETGRYALDGYTITLNYSDGSTQRMIFCASESRDDIYLGNAEFSRH